MLMKRAIPVAVAILAVVALVGCGEKETPEQKVERLRYNHEIIPVAATTLYDAEGQPTLLVDLQVIGERGKRPTPRGSTRAQQQPLRFGVMHLC